MPVYQRMVSYLYEYRGGEKGGNVGYARVEIREEIAKMIVSIRLRRDVSAVCPVEFYYRKGKQAYRIPVGEVRLTGGRAEERLLLSGTGLGLQGLPAAQMGGLRILLPHGLIGSAWDDQNVPLNCEDESERVLSVAEILPEEVESGTMPEMRLELLTELLPEPIPEETSENLAENSPGIPEEEPAEEKPAVEERAVEALPEKPALRQEHFFEKAPRMCPFEDPAITQCVRMEPADLEYLPQEAWVLGSNSFLLHGYYTYGHLILARLRGMGQECTILGVPGLNQSRERFLAHIFGFEHFKPVARAGVEEGEFGYWYMVLPFGEQ